MSTQHTLYTGTKGQVFLGVKMTRRHDRFAAELQFSSNHSSSVPILRSVEGDDRRCWPPSPPIQQLSRQQHDTGEFLAGVGLAGDSHWSLSIVVIDAPIPALEFDVACRVRRDPEWLGSTYEILSGQPIHSETGARLVMDDYILQFEPAAKVGACDVDTDNNRLRVVPRKLTGQLPRTVRWKYRISIADQSLIRPSP